MPYNISQHHSSIRLKLKKAKDLLEDYAEVDVDGPDLTDPVEFCPTQQLGAKRKEEMALLYGPLAPKIQGMETAMHLSFDRKCDKYQPKLWPNIPLSLTKNMEM